ncbi:acetyl-CoA carboxylase biotin carboxyl carrier protein subunit [Polaribacter sp. Q13]|uniref:acetyl-CoA carboxylase biotin carboxyl carrier protein subunit n=1 Tax=Polaribacter sp. Q13 TaxID=2806551 RepID=UPI00193B1AF0|nr:acetyl-CoA carboxylase biotin carboxyl carrier protein subunit [Polaribacter sp. Q13]QVY65699.1 acetyl-CoA carboxylase biotin carboxyl carrier protein subunit [Polaribacter sp. Q13]
MKNSYQVKVNDTFDFNIDEQAVKKLDTLQVSDSEFHVLDNHLSYKTEITKSNFNEKSYSVKVKNTVYDVNIHDQLDTLIKEMGFEIGITKEVNEIKAPMPGLILDINVSVGMEVKEHDTLLILEAMKMENALTSPRAGIIKTISVTKGETVDKDQLLIAFE